MFFAKMNSQEILIKAIRKQLAKQTSIIDEVAEVLNISYDAAHRRISQKSKFSIEEAVNLCTHYSISMDLLFAGQSKVVVEKTKEITSLEDMAVYFKDSADKLNTFLHDREAKMFYSAKDIPLFHTIGGTLLSKFKLYVWINLLTGSQSQESFENFAVNASLLEHSMRLKEVYSTVEVNEIWNDTTINSTLQQVYYFFQSGLLSLHNALLLCNDLQDILHHAETRCCNTDTNYHLYYNELLILNNNVLFTAPQKDALFVPYTMLGYFITEDRATCRNAQEFFDHQIKNSKSLNKSGTRDRKIFFNKAHRKVELYIQQMKNEININF